MVQVEEKEWVKQYVRLGFAIQDDFSGESSYAIAASLRMNDITTYGSYADFQAEIGRAPRLFTELYQPILDSPVFIAPSFELQRQTLFVSRQEDLIAQYHRQTIVAAMRAGTSLGRYGEFSSGIRRGPGKLERDIGDPTLGELDYDVGEVVTQFALDQLDSRDFPNRGYLFSAGHTGSRESLGSDSTFDQMRVNAMKPLSWGLNTILLNGEAANSSDALSPERSYSLGGFFDISGYRPNSLLASNYWIGRTAFYRRIAEGGSALLPFGGYLGGSVEYSNLHSQIEGIGDRTGIVSGSLFIGADTPLLPIYLGYGMSNESEQSFYLSLGTLSARRR